MKTTKILTAVAVSLLLTACGKSDPIPMLVGTYTDKGSEGIYSFSFDQESGKASAQHVAKVANPSYLVIAANDSFMYCVSEGKGEEATVSAYRVSPSSGRMAFLNRVLAHGDDPCYLVTYARNLYVANYSTGNISVYDIERDATLFDNGETMQFDNGTFGDSTRQSGSHIHQVVKSPDGHFLFATDLGGDCLYKYELRPEFKQGEPFKTDLPKGCGPRHMAFSPDSKHAYVVTELSDEVIAFDFDEATGNLVQKQAVKASDAGARGGAEVEVSPDGKHLYASVRLKNDGIAIFSINADGTLKKTGYQPTGKHPRMFKITPNGKYVVVGCMDDDVLQVYERNAETGDLKNTGNDIKVGKPACIVFGDKVPW